MGATPISTEPTIETPEKHSVFISYARADRPRVTLIADAIKAAGYQVWWDAMIDGGAAFAKTIEAKLLEADAVVVVWSKASAESDWVRDEAAHGRDRKRLVPISLDGIEPPLGFRQYHAINFSKWRSGSSDAEMAALLRSIEAIERHEALPETLAPASRGPDRRLVLGLGTGAVLAAAGGAAWVSGLIGGPGRVDNSIAIIPFKNLSGDPAQTYFSDGLSEEVRSTLARNAGLQVAAPTSAAAFRDQAADAKLIGSKLGVAFLLEGSVRRAADVVRIAAELIDTKTGFSKWSQSFDRKIDDIFAVQSEIAKLVAEALMIRVAATPVGGTKNVDAYDAFLRGRTLFGLDGGEASDREGLAQFDKAIALDPNYAAAHAARSRSLGAIASQYVKAEELKKTYGESVAAARRAVALAPELPQAQLALGFALYTGNFDVKGARAYYDRAFALGGGDADIVLLFALYCARTNRRDEAIAGITRAMALDRLNPRAFRTGGVVNYYTRRYAEAVPLLRQALTLNPKLRNANGNIGNCLVQLGKPAEARDAYAVEGLDFMRLSGLAIAEHRLGNTAAAKDWMKKLIDGPGDSALYQQAEVLAQWGETDAAFDALARARKVGDSGILITAIDPMLDPIRNDPRFAQLIVDLGMN